MAGPETLLLRKIVDLSKGYGELSWDSWESNQVFVPKNDLKIYSSMDYEAKGTLA